MNIILHIAMLFSVGGLENNLMDLIANYPDDTITHYIAPLIRSNTPGTAVATSIHEALKAKIQSKIDSGKVVLCSGNLSDIITSVSPNLIHTTCLTFFNDYTTYVNQALTASIPIVSVLHGPPAFQASYFNAMSPTDKTNMTNMMQSLYTLNVIQYAPSTYAVNKNQTFFNYPSNISLLPNGVDTTNFNISREDRSAYRAALFSGAMNDSSILIGSVGRIDLSWKRQDWIVDLIESLHANGHTNTYGIVVGNGQDLATLQTRISNSSCHAYLTTVGAQDDPSACYNAMDIFVQPSKMESFSLVTAEALACGVPAVICTSYAQANNSTDGYGLIKAYGTNQNGVIVPYSTNAATEKANFITSVTALVASPSTLSGLASNARSSIVGNFDIATMVGNYSNVFTPLLP